MQSFNLDTFVEQLKATSKQEDAYAQVRNLMDTTFAHADIINRDMPAMPEDDKVLYEDEYSSIWYVHFVPELVVPPHDHQTQVAIGIIRGSERNYLFRQHEDNLQLTGTAELNPGDTFYLGPKAIHAATACSPTPCNGIHVYMAPLTKIQRSLFDWDTGEARSFDDDTYEQLKRGPEFLERYQAS